jgi:DNA-binding transcriptional LysR family regulator
MYDWAELRHFRYLLAILERQGFRLAAEQLHTSQPNLTVQARQFQENASVRLFQRMKSGRIRPTATGVAFISLAKLLLETRDEVLDALTAIERGEIATIRLGCASFVDQALFRHFCQVHKEILPVCVIRSTHADPTQLALEVADGAVDAAVVTLPLRHPDLHIEEIRSDRLVACLRRDHALAQRTVLRPNDLQQNLAILHHPQGNPEAHEVLLERLAEADITISEYSLASHPSEMQMLVKEGHGFALLREGTPLDPELTTRPVAGVNWTVGTGVIYHKQRHPKTVPLLVKKLKKLYGSSVPQTRAGVTTLQPSTSPRKSPSSTNDQPVQLRLLNER